MNFNFKLSKNKKILILIFIIIIIISIVVKLSYGYEKVEMSKIYVATTGNDESGDGSFDNPYLTLKQAISVAASNTIIYIREGEYIFYNTVKIMNRENIHIVPYNNENVTFTTAHKIKVSDYYCGNTTNQLVDGTINNELGGNISCINFGKYIEDVKNNVVESDDALKSYLSKEDNATTLLEKFSGINKIEIYSGDEELNVAKYPNEDKYLLIDKVKPVYGDGAANAYFYEQKINEKNWNYDFNKNIYVHGFWNYDWQAKYSQATLEKNADSTNLTKVTLSDASVINNTDIGLGQRVAFYNIFEELDVKGEYYFDSSTNYLYIHQNSIVDDKIEFSFEYTDSNYVGDKALIFINNTDKIKIANINFKNIFSHAISGEPDYIRQTIDGTTYREITNPNTETLIENNNFKNINGMSIILYDSEKDIIRNNTFKNLGNTAIAMIELDTYRYNLTRQENLITNNQIENFDTKVLQNQAIRVYGVGNTISHNEISNGASHGIRFYGNNNIVEYNEIYDVVDGIGDAAAIYSGSDLTYLGNIIQNNYIHDIKLRIKEKTLENEFVDLYNNLSDYQKTHNGYISAEDYENKITYSGVFGVYIDDVELYTTVKNNIFYNVDTIYNVNGGSGNKVENNIFINAKNAVNVNAVTSAVDGYLGPRVNRIVLSPYYDASVWQKAYPKIYENILSKNTDTEYIKTYISDVKDIVIKNNLVYTKTGIDNELLNNEETYCDYVLSLRKNGDLALNGFATTISDEINEVNINYIECSYNTYKTAYSKLGSKRKFGLQDGYTNNVNIFKNYSSEDFNLNLEEVQKILPEFEDIHFNRMGKDKIIAIKLNTDNIKNKYIQNYETLDLTGGKITATYSDGSEKTINLSNAEIIGFDNSNTGSIELTAVYNNEAATFNVEIIPKSMTGIEIATVPNKLKYLEDKEQIDLTGGLLRVKYNDNTTETIDLKNTTLTGFDNTKLGEQQIKVEYQGFETSFNIEIIEPKKAKTISIIQYPQKLQYIQNYETLNLSGGVLEVAYNDGTKELVNFEDSRVSIDGFNNKDLGQKEISLKIEDITIKYNVEIVSKRVSKISILTLPSKLKYIQNKEEIDLTGGVIEITYDDNSIDKISMNNSLITLSGYSNEELGSQRVRVLYQGKRAEFYVTIVAPEIEEIKVNTLPIKTKYIINTENIDLTGGVLEVIYKDGTRDLISMTNTNVNVTGFDNTIIGNNNIKLKYLDKEVNFNVEIIDKTIQDIKLITEPLKNKYIRLFEQLDLTGGVIEVTYTDGTTSQISLTNEEVKVSGFDNRTAGDNKITIEYKGQKIEYTVEIIEQGNGLMDFLASNSTLINGLNIGLLTLSIGLVAFFTYQVQKNKKAENIA